MALPATSLTLLARARNRDDEAWQRLVALYAPLVKHWLRTRVAASDIDDLTQDTFAAVAASLDKFRRDQPSDSFRGWLQGVARHKVANYYRRRPGSGAVGGTDAQIAINELADPNACWGDDDAEQMSALHQRALELVRSEFEVSTWQMFWRVAIDGRRAADVAVELNSSPASVRMAKSRVLRRLREELGDILED
jgi:RNA polymerase sigma-70 factor (ECF subfamily)